MTLGRKGMTLGRKGMTLGHLPLQPSGSLTSGQLSRGPQARSPGRPLSSHHYELCDGTRATQHMCLSVLI